MLITKYFKYVFAISIIILGCSMLFPKYVEYCNSCVRECSIKTNYSIKTCLSQCNCPNVLPKQMKHVNNLEIFDSDIKNNLCPNGYSGIPKVEKKLFESTLSSRSVSPPNIILFLLDDLDEMITPYFEAMPFAKELFKLNGTHFSNTFSTVTYCSPSRSTLLTSLYAHNHGSVGYRGPYGSVGSFRKPFWLNGTRMTDSDGKCISNENRTINVILQQHAGYYTSIFGKYLNNIENSKTRTITYPPPYWDELHIMSCPYGYSGTRYMLTNYSSNDKSKGLTYEVFGIEEKDYITDVLTNKVINVIHNQRINKKSKQPIFAYVATPAPHLPLPPADRHRHHIEFWQSQYDTYVTNRPNYNYTHESRAQTLLSNPLKTVVTEEGDKWNRLEWEKRLTSLYAVNEMIQRIYNKIKDLDELDNTVFVLTSDNGYNLLAHQYFNKMKYTDESTKVPLYVSGPGFYKNFVNDELTLLNDITPTFVSLAGLQIPSYMNGKSLIPTDVSKKRDSVLIQFKNNVKYIIEDTLDQNPEISFVKNQIPKWLLLDFLPYVALRTRDFLYVEHTVVNDMIKYTNGILTEQNHHIEYELFDLTTDPDQIYNVYNNSKYHDDIIRLKNRLTELTNCVGNNCI